MSRRGALWVAFAIVHVVVAVLGFVGPNLPMGDVTNVYDPWSQWAVDGIAIVGIDQPWVYPQLALIPMVLARALDGIAGYELAWAILVTACNALGFWMLLGRARSRGRVTAAWFWLAYTLLLGSIAMYRIDAITIPLAIAGCLWLAGRPMVGSALLAVATWIKVWPAALLAAAFIALRRRWRVALGAVLVSAVTLGAIVAAGGAANAFGFVGDQTGRGLQLEAPVSMLYVWQAAAGVPGSFVYYDQDMLTYQVAGPQVDVVIAVMTPLLAIAMLAVAALGAYRSWQGASYARLFPSLALAFVLTFIVFNKVGSPQYMTWIVVPLVMGLVIDRRRWRRPALFALAIAATTQVVYPFLYLELLMVRPLAVAALTLRNALVVAFLVLVIVDLVRMPVRRRIPAVAPSV
ncbi:glycosyltransferase 87 family protein [Microbacterium fluvii]|uniref:Glycosyltransferase 87 family protein n=1 Tax=Microbacterium fluvii TaxID=415215 RepID=A0ABW2H935_9MICO|nr:glycosyltransferase 87 family protein [Microbacterium fluvii]MCU4671492.1 glycosyltransferase 87 family protein [Microbacterium fluvii]